MKRILLIGLSTLLLAIAGCNDDGLSINVSEQQLESRMSSYFPYTKKASLGSLRISEPDLILKDGSERAELVLKSEVITRLGTWPGTFTLSFGVDYGADTGTFYLVEPRIESFNARGIPSQIESGVTQYLLPLVQQYLTRIPVYTLDASASTNQNIARRTLKKMSIKDQALKINLGLVDTK